jgi:hypothetical protein
VKDYIRVRKGDENKKSLFLITTCQRILSTNRERKFQIYSQTYYKFDYKYSNSSPSKYYNAPEKYAKT